MLRQSVKNDMGSDASQRGILRARSRQILDAPKEICRQSLVVLPFTKAQYLKHAETFNSEVRKKIPPGFPLHPVFDPFVICNGRFRPGPADQAQFVHMLYLFP